MAEIRFRDATLSPIEQSMDNGFPLTSGDGGDLLPAMRRRLEQIHHAE